MKSIHPIYDIRNSEAARNTLVTLTSVPLSTWLYENQNKSPYDTGEDFVSSVVKQYGSFPSTYQNFDFIYLHITTSANICTSFRKHGILNLCKAYECSDSELRHFLDSYDIHIDLSKQLLQYHNRCFDIHYYNDGHSLSSNTLEYAQWSIGRKLYFDYGTCGFLSTSAERPYGGLVHKRPEILENIDDLLGTQLCEEWLNNYKPYKIIARVAGSDIIYDGPKHDSERDRVIRYLAYAYWNAFTNPSENIVLIKPDVTIQPQNILEITHFDDWQ